MSSNHIVNPELQAMAFAAVASLEKAAAGVTKNAFVPGGSPAMDPAAAAGGGGAPPGDPSVGGGGDPNAMAGGAAPPPPPAAPAPSMSPAMQTVEPIKPKIDVNVTLLQILKLLARISDALGIPVPASEMVATQNDLTQMGMQQQNGAPDGGAAGGGAAGGQQSSIPPISPIAPAAPGMGSSKQGSFNNGSGYDSRGMAELANHASALDRVRAVRARK